MPEAEEKKTVDIDTSGPAMDVDIPEEKDEATIEGKEVVQKEEPTIREVVEEKPAAEPVVKEETKEVKEEPKEFTEEKKEEELEQYSEGVQKRIAKLTKKWREAERQKDEAITYAEKMIVAKNRTDAKISKLEPSYLSVSEEGIKTGLEAAKAKLAAAREANDLGAEATALQDISELGVRNVQLKDTKAAQEEYNKQQSTQKAPSLARSLAAKGTPDPKAEAWAEKNSWFGQNNAMTYTAMDLHDKLTKQEGFDSSSDEYYAEIDKRIKLEFPHKFDRTTLAEGTTKPVQTVASAKRSTKTGRKTVRLTPSQVTIAKKLGVPLEEYAKQLNITKES
jgi:hypothetical protein